MRKTARKAIASSCFSSKRAGDPPRLPAQVFRRSGGMESRFNALVTITRLVGLHPKLGDFIAV